MAKKILCIGMLVMVMVFVIGCGQKGGTIVIENDYPTAWAVAIGSSSTRPDSTDISPGQKYEKSFAYDGTYYAFGKFTVTGWRTKKVSLSGGETVILKGGDFF
jgi:hypothetical protein